MTTMRRARPSLMYSATASRVRLFSVCGGVFSSTMRDSSWPILPCLPTLPLFLLRPFSWLRPFLPCCNCWRWALCLRPMVDVGRLNVWRGRAKIRVTVETDRRETCGRIILHPARQPRRKIVRESDKALASRQDIFHNDLASLLELALFVSNATTLSLQQYVHESSSRRLHVSRLSSHTRHGASGLPDRTVK